MRGLTLALLLLLAGCVEQLKNETETVQFEGLTGVTKPADKINGHYAVVVQQGGWDNVGLDLSYIVPGFSFANACRAPRQVEVNIDKAWYNGAVATAKRLFKDPVFLAQHPSPAESKSYQGVITFMPTEVDGKIYYNRNLFGETLTADAQVAAIAVVKKADGRVKQVMLNGSSEINKDSAAPLIANIETKECGNFRAVSQTVVGSALSALLLDAVKQIPELVQ